MDDESSFNKAFEPIVDNVLEKALREEGKSDVEIKHLKERILEIFATDKELIAKINSLVKEPALAIDFPRYAVPATVDSIKIQLEETKDEIAILQEYARSVGKRIPEKVLNDLGTLVNMSAEASLGDELILALSVHGELSEVVAPLTVHSLKATDPNQTLLSWLRHLWAIPVIFILTLLAFILFVTQTTNVIKINQASKSSVKSENSPK